MARKPIIAAGIDAGAFRTRCLIGVVEDSCLRLIGVGETPSQGWQKGRINDQGAVAASIAQAVQDAERMAEVSLESVAVGMAGPTTRGANSRGILDIGRPREIEQRDVNRAVERAARVQLPEDRMVLQLFTQDFVVDDHPGHRDPRRMVAARIEANLHLITTSIQEHDRLVAAVNHANLAVEESVFEPIAAAYAAVLPEERRQGLALLDLGAQSSGLAVYAGEALQLAAHIPVCGDHFTRDVARGLTTTFEDAAKIKEEYGCALVGLTADNTLIEVPSGEERVPRETTRGRLNQILEARAIELFQYVLAELSRVGMQRALMNGVVITGGLAKLNGVCDVAERVLNCQARKGLAVGILDWPDELNEPSWTSAAGVLMYSARLKLQSELQRRPSGLLARIFQS